jgi:hypothetical protein
VSLEVASPAKGGWLKEGRLTLHRERRFIGGSSLKPQHSLSQQRRRFL